MLNRTSIFAGLSAIALLTAFPAAAQEHGAEGGGEASEAEVARSVELGGIVFPVFDEKDRKSTRLNSSHT